MVCGFHRHWTGATDRGHKIGEATLPLCRTGSGNGKLRQTSRELLPRHARPAGWLLSGLGPPFSPRAWPRTTDSGGRAGGVGTTWSLGQGRLQAGGVVSGEGCGPCRSSCGPGGHRPLPRCGWGWCGAGEGRLWSTPVGAWALLPGPPASFLLVLIPGLTSASPALPCLWPMSGQPWMPSVSLGTDPGMAQMPGAIARRPIGQVIIRACWWLLGGLGPWTDAWFHQRHPRVHPPGPVDSSHSSLSPTVTTHTPKRTAGAALQDWLLCLCWLKVTCGRRL